MSDEAAVARVGETLNRTLEPDRNETAPREHFSPVQVRFPVNAPPLRPPLAAAGEEDRMPNVVNFEDENGVDAAGALREGIQAIAKINWDDNDLKFVFKKMEISMAAAGAKKQYTKFQIVSTILPKHIEDEVKCLLEMQETEFGENDSYKQLKSENP